jgi:hypothetical protein
MRNIHKISSIVCCWLAFSGCANRETQPVPVKVIHDTIYVGDQSDPVLKGTTVLKSSEANLESGILHGLWLNSLHSTECQDPISETPRATEITSVKQTDDSTLVISANIVANCSYSFLGEIEVKDNTLNLIYHGYGGYAECMCDFGLTYKVEIVRDREIKFNKLKYVTINGYAKKALPPIKWPLPFN